MAFFGRSKKETTAQPRHKPIYNSRLNLNDEYVNSSQQHISRSELRPDPSYVHTTPPPSRNNWVPVAQYQPINITNNFLVTPPLPERPHGLRNVTSRFNLNSMSNLLSGDVPECVPGAQMINHGFPAGTQYLNQGAALYDLISSKLDNIITLIDGESWSGDEGELMVPEPTRATWEQEAPSANRSLPKRGKGKSIVDKPISSTIAKTNYFAKANMYANSRLPSDLPPMKLYIPTFPLLCMAARYSERVYNKPEPQERETHVDADFRLGTKAMVIKSIPMDEMNIIVFAIRGSQSFMDWAVNLNSTPSSPDGFLDDMGNLCHAGFLSVAKKMVKPVAVRLENLLKENPSRSRYSLLITGHSAGGAVAALLYSHMLSTSRETRSDLNKLTGCFKRVHCVTFGSPPVSLLPLSKPSHPSLKKSLFLSFINEGDPVPRVDKAYVKSLLDLYATPAPSQPKPETLAPQKSNALTYGRFKSSNSLNVTKSRHEMKKTHSSPSVPLPPIWQTPEATLSNAGRLVLLRGVEKYETTSKKKNKIQDRMDDGVVAQIVTDELLRGVIWGDPVCHMMRLYARRIEVLATNAVMGMGP